MFLEKNFKKKMEEFRKRKKRERERERERGILKCKLALIPT